MSEILFRGKRIDNGEWVEGWYYKRIVHLNTFHQNVVVDAIEVYDGENPLSIAYYDVYPETVGQYTGLTDKNGKKIFEGDIVVAEGYVYACQWNNCNIEFELANEVESFGMCYVSPDVEVIGNIHDNPELLTQKNI